MANGPIVSSGTVAHVTNMISRTTMQVVVKKNVFQSKSKERVMSCAQALGGALNNCYYKLAIPTLQKFCA